MGSGLSSRTDLAKLANVFPHQAHFSQIQEQSLSADLLDEIENNISLFEDMVVESETGILTEESQAELDSLLATQMFLLGIPEPSEEEIKRVDELDKTLKQDEVLSKLLEKIIGKLGI